MDRILRPSHAFPAPCETVSALHDFVSEGIAKELEAIAAEVWDKFSIRIRTPEEHEAFHKAVREKTDRLYPPRIRVIQNLEIVAIRKE